MGENASVHNIDMNAFCLTEAIMMSGMSTHTLTHKQKVKSQIDGNMAKLGKTALIVYSGREAEQCAFACLAEGQGLLMVVFSLTCHRWW